VNKIKMPIVAAVICAFTAVTTPAFAWPTRFLAGASEGSILDANVIAGKAVPQKFKTSGGTLECEKVMSSGKFSMSKTAALKEEVKYSKCKAFNLFIFALSPAKYEFNANGEVALESELILEPEGGGCQIRLPPQSGLKGITYHNIAMNGHMLLEAVANVSSITYTSSGGVCGSSGSNGVYEETSLVDAYSTAAPLTQVDLLVGGTPTEPHPEITVKPSEVKFGNVTKGERAVEYTNKGAGSWVVPKLEYTVKEGSTEAVKVANGCNGKTLKTGEKCSVTLTYEVAKSGNYMAEIKLGSEAPVVPVKAE
jgi:hypothetical protein